MPTRFATFVDGMHEFDAAAFGLFAAEAAAMDVQQRVLLEEAAVAFADSGRGLADVLGTDTGEHSWGVACC